MSRVEHRRRWALAAVAVLVGTAGGTEVPLVVFDVPLTAECRDVTPKGFREAYKREIIETVFKVSPQLLAGEEKDLKRLHYEISTEQQMPVVSYLPSSQVDTDVVDGTIAIQNSSRHGELSFRYLILPTTGNGDLKGDLESSHAQYGRLAPKQLLLAAGTIERGYGVYFDLKPSSQDTLQKQREFACLFDVPLAWRADYVTIRCNARGTKRGFGGLVDSNVACGSGLLCVGLYKQDDGEARAYAGMLARKQQTYFNRLSQQASTKSTKATGLGDSLSSLERMVSGGTVMKAKQPETTGIGAAVQSQIEEGQPADLPQDAQSARDEVKAAKDELRKMNGKKG
jgi:hypothetical protein